MAAFSRTSMAKALSAMGLKKVFIAKRKGDEYSINRLTTPGGELTLKKMGSFSDPDPLMIGRVGMAGLACRTRSSASNGKIA